MLARKVAIGSVLMVSARLIARLVDLVTMLVLARILVPADFGLVAIAASVVSIAEAALEIPVNQALVRLSAITMRQYDTAFTLSALRGLALTIALPLMAAPVASFYGEPRLVPLICVLSLAPAARGLISPRLAEFQKAMNFWRDFWLELGGKLVAFGAGLAIALLTGSYWSIVVGTVVMPVVSSAASYIVAPYRPRLTLADLAVFRGFVGWMTAAQIVSAVNWQFERLLLGKVVTTARVGVFTASSDLAGIPFLAFFGPVLRPLLAGFSHVRDDRDRLAQSYLSSLGAIGAVGLPLLVGESLVADPAVRLILGPQWLDAVPLVELLSLSLIPALFALPAVPLIMSFGQTRLIVYRNLVEFGVKLPLAIVGLLQFGLMGIVAARLVSELAAVGVSIVLVRRLAGISASAQVVVCWRSVAASLAMALPVVALRSAMPAPMDAPSAAITLAVLVATGAGVYLVTLWLLWLVSGRPAGIEAMLHETITSLLGRLLGRKGVSSAQQHATPP